MSNNFNLPEILARQKLTENLPVGNGWFSPEAMRLNGGEAGKLTRSLAKEIGIFLQAIKDKKNDLFLSSATGVGIDEWGSDVNIFRELGESDDSFKNRISSEILQERVTRFGVSNYISRLTGLPTLVYLPWRLQEFRSNRFLTLEDGTTPLPYYDETNISSAPALDAQDLIQGRSGSTRRSSAYWQGGVIDIFTLDFSSKTRILAPKVVAAGIKCYYSVINENDIIVFDNTGAYQLADKDVWLNYFKYIPLYYYEYDGRTSVDRYRSGYQLIQQFLELAYEALVLDTSEDELSIKREFFGLHFDAPLTLDDATDELLVERKYVEKYFEKTLLETSDLYTLESGKQTYIDLKSSSYVYGLPTLWDEPSYGLGFSVWDTIYTWDELDTVTWDTAILPGFFESKHSELTIS